MHGGREGRRGTGNGGEYSWQHIRLQGRSGRNARGTMKGKAVGACGGGEPQESGPMAGKGSNGRA